MDRQEIIAEIKSHEMITSYDYLSGEDGQQFVVNYASYGDYCGGYVEMANNEVLFETGIVRRRYEGYGSCIIVFDDNDLNDADDDKLEELLDLLNSLASYPALDDELSSKYEYEAAMEAHEDWGRKDFIEALEKKGVKVPDTTEEIDELFYSTGDKIGEYYHQDGPGMTIYINIDRIVSEILPDPEFLNRCLALS